MRDLWLCRAGFAVRTPTARLALAARTDASAKRLAARCAPEWCGAPERPRELKFAARSM